MPEHEGKSNGESEKSEVVSWNELCTVSEEPSIFSEGKNYANFKSPRELEALSPSSLTTLRYAHEVDGIGRVIALDNSKGTRMWRRGANQKGGTANFIETKQLLDIKGFRSSFLQYKDIRFWN